jgi:hypothetical protein
MFEHRLGLALGKSVSEIRALPAAEFIRWQLYNQVEPFGWHNDEYHYAILLAMLYNINRDSKQSARTPEDFMRDYQSEVMRLADNMDIQNMLDRMTASDRKAFVVKQVKRDFGIP